MNVAGAVAVVGGLLLRYRDGADAAAAASPRAALVFDQEGGRLRLGLAWTAHF